MNQKRFEVDEIHIPAGDFEHVEDDVYQSNIWSAILGAVIGMIAIIALLVLGKAAGIP